MHSYAALLGNNPTISIAELSALPSLARVPPEHISALQERASFLVWDPTVAEVRWMTAWDTTEQDVEQFAAAVREVLR